MSSELNYSWASHWAQKDVDRVRVNLAIIITNNTCTAVHICDRGIAGAKSQKYNVALSVLVPNPRQTCYTWLMVISYDWDLVNGQFLLTKIHFDFPILFP